MKMRCVVAAAASLSLAAVLQGCGGSGGGGGGGGKGSGTCGSEMPSKVEDCQNEDLGSCGNACCNLVLSVAGTPDDIQKALINSLSRDGGFGGGYALQPTAEGPLGFANLSADAAMLPPPFKDSKSVWIGQAHHTTSGEAHFVDTINLNMRTGQDGNSIVRAFSVSGIGGALGDNGQNYKNIMGLLTGLKFNVTEHVNGSCPAAQSTATMETMSKAIQEAAAPVVRSLSAESGEKGVKSSGPVAGSCGQKPTPPDCKNVDFGSCGNACCSLVIRQAFDPATAMQKINASLSKGGPDGGYTLQMIHGGAVGFGNLSNIVPKLPAPWNTSLEGLYLGQVVHMTSGPKHYNDTINIAVYHHAALADSYIHATSVSGIGGALGDEGQNYKNIIMVMNAAFGQWHAIHHHAFNSCPDPGSTPTPGPTPGPTPKPTPGPTPVPSTCKATISDGMNVDNNKNVASKPTTTQDECCAYCTAIKGCAAWTWNKDKTKDPLQNCYLHSAWANPVKDDGVVSGKMPAAEVVV